MLCQVRKFFMIDFSLPQVGKIYLDLRILPMAYYLWIQRPVGGQVKVCLGQVRLSFLAKGKLRYVKIGQVKVGYVRLGQVRLSRVRKFFMIDFSTPKCLRQVTSIWIKEFYLWHITYGYKGLWGVWLGLVQVRLGQDYPCQSKKHWRPSSLGLSSGYLELRWRS